MKVIEDKLCMLNKRNGNVKIINKLFGNQVFSCEIDLILAEEKVGLRIGDYDICIPREQINEIIVYDSSAFIKGELMEIRIICPQI